jgi:hypothetical protein
LLDGIGVEANRRFAEDHFKAAMEQGHRLAREAYNELVPSQRQTASPRARTVTPGQVSPAGVPPPEPAARPPPAPSDQNHQPRQQAAQGSAQSRDSPPSAAQGKRPRKAGTVKRREPGA